MATFNPILTKNIDNYPTTVGNFIIDIASNILGIDYSLDDTNDLTRYIIKLVSKDDLDDIKETITGSIPEASNSIPLANGTAAAGNSNTWARADHIHPLQTTITGNAGSATKLATARTIALSGAATGNDTSFDGTDNITIPVTSLDATKLSGIIPIACIPQGALERIYIVTNDAARLALTTASVQNGDVVKVTDSSLMYYIKDETKLGTEDAFEPFVAGAAASVAWANVTGKPSIPEASTIIPKENGTAAVGSSNTWARADHVHPAQTTITGNAGSANKVNSDLIIKFNNGTIEGTDLFTFNGSAVKTVNITPALIGAAAEDHNHNNYLPLIGGTMTGKVIAQNNTDYATKQIRNIFIISEEENLPIGSSGDICLIYTP